MATNTAAATIALRGFTQAFDTRAAQYTPFWPRIARQVNSTGEDEKYGWVGQFPGMREWLGERQFHELMAADYTLKNKLWESSLLIERTVIDDNRWASQIPLIEGLADEAMAHPDELMFQVLVAGESTVGYDGQFFFDTDHVMGDSGSQSNDLTYAAATGTTPTAAEFRAAYNASYAKMLSYKGDKGKFLYRPTQAQPIARPLVLVTPTLYPTALDALSARFDSDGNPIQILGNPEVVPIAYLTNDAKFYTLNTGGRLKPFVFQAREPLRRQAKGYRDGDIEFKHAKFMTEARYNVGYLAWWEAVLTTFT